MIHVNQYETLSEALTDLRQRGFTDDFDAKKEPGGIYSHKTKQLYKPGDLTIVEHHRFEGNSDPGDMAIVYAIESRDGAKGVIIDAFGPYANAYLGEILKRIKTQENTSHL